MASVVAGSVVVAVADAGVADAAVPAAALVEGVAEDAAPASACTFSSKDLKSAISFDAAWLIGVWLLGGCGTVSDKGAVLTDVSGAAPKRDAVAWVVPLADGGVVPGLVPAFCRDW